MRRTWMKRTLQAAPAMLALALAPVAAQAVPVDDYIINFSAAGLAEGNSSLTDVEHVDEWKFTGYSYIGFFDNDGSGGISKDDTFVDYVAIRIDQFQDMWGNTIEPDGYGDDYELTVVAKLLGVQTSDNTYKITAIEEFDLWFDAKDDSGLNFTPTDFTNVAATMVDGTKVESGALRKGGGNNAGPVAPDGSIDLFLDLTDWLVTTSVGEYFELDADGNPFPMDLTVGITDANNHLQSNDPPVSGLAAGLASYFGFSPGSFAGSAFIGGEDEFGNAFGFGFLAKSDGSFNKAVVPEPGTMLLLGSGLVGVAGVARRRRKQSS